MFSSLNVLKTFNPCKFWRSTSQQFNFLKNSTHHLLIDDFNKASTTQSYSKNSDSEYHLFTPRVIHVSHINYLQLKSILGRPNQVLIDVRSPKEVQAGKIPTSINIPVVNIQEEFSQQPDIFEKKFDVKMPAKKDLVICHCHNGKRSIRACATLMGMGFHRVVNYKGGWKDWKKKVDEEQN